MTGEELSDDAKKKGADLVDQAKKITKIPGVKSAVSTLAGSMVATNLQARATMDGLEKFCADMNQPTRIKLKNVLDKAIEEHGKQ